MSIDPKGTKPGVVAPASTQKFVDVKCRNQDCDSTRAVEIPIDRNMGREGAPSNRMYQCVKCHRSWGLPVGGAFMH